MGRDDGIRWDGRYRENRSDDRAPVGPPRLFAPFVDVFPTTGTALELACGEGRGAVWLAKRGLTVVAVDVSSVAVDRARHLAEHHGVSSRCRFVVADLDDGLPPGPPVDLLLCHLFRDASLDQPIIDRLAPGGLLALAALSEVDAEPGRFRTRPGELTAAFSSLEPVASGEADGEAWLLARRW